MPHEEEEDEEDDVEGLLLFGAGVAVVDDDAPMLTPPTWAQHLRHSSELCKCRSAGLVKIAPPSGSLSVPHRHIRQMVYGPDSTACARFHFGWMANSGKESSRRVGACCLSTLTVDPHFGVGRETGRSGSAPGTRLGTQAGPTMDHPEAKASRTLDFCRSSETQAAESYRSAMSEPLAQWPMPWIWSPAKSNCFPAVGYKCRQEWHEYDVACSTV